MPDEIAEEFVEDGGHGVLRATGAKQVELGLHGRALLGDEPTKATELLQHLMPEQRHLSGDRIQPIVEGGRVAAVACGVGLRGFSCWVLISVTHRHPCSGLRQPSWRP